MLICRASAGAEAIYLDRRFTETHYNCFSPLKRLHWSRLLDLFTALFACPPRVVVPEIEHRLAKVLHDVGAVEVNVFHQCPAIFTIENDMFLFARRPTTLDHHAERVRWPLRGV